jgi:GT2 family glycosyltransferase
MTKRNPKTRGKVSLSVSIVVPSYQGVERLPRLLTALENQNATCKWQVIIVLDGSSDGSRELLEPWQTKLPLKVIARENNLGRSATLNEGFAAAEYEVLVRCDDDLVPGPNYVQTYSNLITQNPRVGVMGLYKNQYPSTRYSRAYGEMVDQRFRKEAYEMPPSKNWVLWAGNVGVSKDAFQSVGYYDTLFREYGYEDIDWGYRLFKAGIGIMLAPELETPHLIAATSCSRRCERARWSGRANEKFNQKHRQTPQPPAKTLWNSAVKLASHFSGKAFGSLIDWVLPVLPPRIALRVIDLAVQAAFMRGQREANA